MHDLGGERPFAIENAGGRGPAVVICDHASNTIPAPWSNLGLSVASRETHIAWDLGALALSRRLAAWLDAPLIFATVSRLVIDVNRPLSSAALIPTLSETTAIPGNANLTAADRQRRLESIYEPYHAAVDQLIGDLVARRAATGLVQPAVIAIHTFTPVFKGLRRPWNVGVIYDTDDRLGNSVLAGLKADRALCVARNEPYAPRDDVYFTLERHAVRRGLTNVMIEIRNDQLRTNEAQGSWAKRLAEVITGALGEAAASGTEVGTTSGKVLRTVNGGRKS